MDHRTAIHDTASSSLHANEGATGVLRPGQSEDTRRDRVRTGDQVCSKVGMNVVVIATEFGRQPFGQVPHGKVANQHDGAAVDEIGE